MKAPAFYGIVLIGLTVGSLHADIVGSNPYTALPMLDSCSGCVFAYVEFGAANAGQTVLSYQFYNGAGAGTSNYLTPLLLEETSSTPGVSGSTTFDVLAIGAPSTGFAAGYNSESFTPVAGSATVLDSNTFFGYVDGNVATGEANTGTITTNYPTGPGATTYYHAPVGTFGLGSITGFNAFTDEPIPGQKDRTYSLQVTTTPEPGLYGLLGVGLCAAAFVVRRRRIRSINS